MDDERFRAAGEAHAAVECANRARYGSVADDAQRPRLSVIIPAYNEAQRLPPYLQSIQAHLGDQYGTNYEVIVVDDGSQDELAAVVEQIARHWPQLRLCRHGVNRGKGAAVTSGMLASQGQLLLFADADGATPIEEEARLRSAILSGADIAIGSRFVKMPDAGRERSWLRELGGWLFTTVVHWYVRLPVQDTQCGFKMFRREAGMNLFALCDERGYLFDVLILRIAARLGYKIAEVGVKWREISGSKVNPICDFWRMSRGLSGIDRRIDQLLEKGPGSSSRQHYFLPKGSSGAKA